MDITVYNYKLSNCGSAYVKCALISSNSSEGSKIRIYLAEDKSAGGSFSFPGTYAPISFNLDNKIIFNGIAQSYSRFNSTSEAIAIYELVAVSPQDQAQVGDQIFGYQPLTADVYINLGNTLESVLNPAGVSFSTANFQTYTVITGDVPSNYGSFISWYSISYDHNNSKIKIPSAIYKTFALYNQPNGYYLKFDIPLSVGTITLHSSPGGTSTDPNASSSGTTTTSGTGSNSTTTTTSLNAFGAGSVVTVAPNSGNLPVGTSSYSTSSNGFTTTVKKEVTAATVKTTTTTTFQSSPNTTNASFQATKNRRKMMGIPDNFQGAIDPTKAFPSFEITTASSSSESGRFFNYNASPTSFDLDPYFFFKSTDGTFQNDFQHVMKDGYSDTSNARINVDPYKNNVRTMGIRGPVLLSGWGYDMAGLPVPNGEGLTVQTGVINGKPQYGSDPSGKYKFNPKTPTNRALWKTGPVDLRWHDKKKVWVGGHETLEGYLMANLTAPTSQSGSTIAKMSVRRVAESGGLKNGTPEYITITNRDPSLSASSGAYCIVMDINYEWRPIYIGC